MKKLTLRELRHKKGVSIGQMAKELSLDKSTKTGGQEAVDSFYETIGKEHNPNITIVYKNDNMDSWLYEHNFTSYPLFYVFNEEGKNVGSILGLTTSDDFTANYLGLFFGETPLYEVKTTQGATLSEAIKLQTIANSYINQLTEIDVPNTYIKEYEGN